MISNIKVKWLLLALLVLVVCRPAASCGTTRNGTREAITVSIHRGC